LCIQAKVYSKGGWFGIAVTVYVTSTKLSCVERGLGTTFGGSTTPVFFQPPQPGPPSVDRFNEYQKWFQPSLGRNGTPEVMTLWRVIN